MQLPSKQILSVAQMQAAEHALMGAGTSVDQLMKTAGTGAAEWIWRCAAGRAVTVLCGPGNNGGDGYVIAEVLRARGLAVSVVAPIAPKTAAAMAARRNLKSAVMSSGKECHGAILVDCLFGSGLSRPLSAELALILRDLADRHPIKIAVDLPSGVSSDNGSVLNEGLPVYDLTLALGAWKFAHWLMPASVKMGARRLVPIGAEDIDGAASLLSKPILAVPEAGAHKYSRGLAAVIAGQMPGAAVLASKAAMHAGAGYVKLRLGCPSQGPGDYPADMVIDPQALSDKRLNAVLVGPGLGRDSAAKGILTEALRAACPLVLDADALHLLRPDMLKRGPAYIATPHAGELAQLCKSFAVIALGKVQQAKALASASGMVIAAKGPDTVIAAPDGQVAIAPPATSWLSVAGTGDVLAGIITSRLAAGSDAFTAVFEGVWLHGEAARLTSGPFTASELAGRVSEAYAACL